MRWIALLALLAPCTPHAAEYFVAPDGSDSADGTFGTPWRTLTHAAATAAAGDSVFLRGGTYSQRVVFTRSGTPSAPIVFRSQPGEAAILDGTSLALPTGWAPFLWLSGVSHVTLQGLEIRNLTTATKNSVPIGILVSGAGSGVRILSNFIHHIETRVTSTSGGDAHGIAIYGDASTPRTATTIAHNTLADLKLGSSEALVLNGNVDGFVVEDNTVIRCNNIGIDAIGHEGTSPDTSSDAARNGVIRRNTVSDITSRGNPAYGQDRSAGGIYIDGGRDILVERNTVSRCDIGIELASEHAGKGTTGVRVRNNLIHGNTIGGIFLGGYDNRRGYTADCTIEHNTLWRNDTAADGNGEIHLQHDIRDTAFHHNLVAAGAQGLLVGHPFTKVTNLSFDRNLYATPPAVAPEWQWMKQYKSSLSSWRSATAKDTNSLHTHDPVLIDPAGGDFRLRPASPARDLGDPGFAPAPGETDHGGLPRRNDSATDAGAHEFDLTGYALPAPPRVLLIRDPAAAVALTYSRARGDVSYLAEASTNLLHWTTDGISQDTSAPVGVTATASMTLQTNGTTACFLRLRLRTPVP